MVGQGGILRISGQTSVTPDDQAGVTRNLVFALGGVTHTISAGQAG